MKSKAWEYLIGRTGVGVDSETGVIVVLKKGLEEFVLVSGIVILNLTTLLTWSLVHVDGKYNHVLYGV